MPAPRERPQRPFRRAAVVGVGLIGGSIARTLRERGLAKRVVGVVRSAERVEQALACGVVEEATTDFESACGGADLVVIATPVDGIARFACMAALHAAPDALVTDAGSTKAQIVSAIDAHWPADGDGLAFVGGHPLAGDHRTGPEAARADLFDGATTVLTPSDKTPPEATARITRLWTDMGATVIEMTSERHDELIALTSHVPHVAAAAVAATTPPDALPLAATGWADTTRVAAGSSSLWREILLANSQPIAGGLRRLAEELNAYANALDAADGDTLEQRLEAGRHRRESYGDQRDALGS